VRGLGDEARAAEEAAVPAAVAGAGGGEGAPGA